jgi:thiol-disulfide isomerase/thioredoxin
VQTYNIKKNEMKQSLILFIAFTYATANYAQGKALITLTSTKQIPVEIFMPIDGAFQFFTRSEQLDLQPSIPIKLDCWVDDFTAIRLRVSSNNVTLFLFPGDHITINHIDGDQIDIIGNNAVAHIYYNRFVRGIMTNFISRIREATLQASDFETIVDDLEKSVLRKVKDSLELLKQNGEISPKLISLLFDDISMFFYNHTHTILRDLHRNRTLEKHMQVSTLTESENIFLKITPLNSNAIRYPLGSGILSNYYRHFFNKMIDEDKQKLLQGYDTDDFGSNVVWLLAPDYIRLPMLGQALALRQQFRMPGFDEFNEAIVYEYLKKNYPESEYVALLSDIYDKEVIQEPGFIHFISQSVNSLSDFSNISELKGKYLLVDLWATWCIPCRMEFTHKDRVKKILEIHKNLATLYISIDVDARDSLWRTDVEELRLEGYHIRASKNLTNDIKEKIFQSKTIAVPRYILISPIGELLDINLPRPSAGNALAEAIQKHLKTI